jgi:hypothetical protein
LSILQEYIRRGRYNTKPLVDFRDVAVAHHHSVLSQIEDVTNPITVVRRFNGLDKFDPAPPVDMTKMPGMIPGDDIRSLNCHNEPFLSETITGRLFFWLKKVEASSPDAELTQAQIDFLTPAANKSCSGAGLNQSNCRWWGQPVASLANTRAKLKRDSTDMGQVMIAQWQGAKVNFPRSPRPA